MTDQETAEKLKARINRWQEYVEHAPAESSGEASAPPPHARATDRPLPPPIVHDDAAPENAPESPSPDIVFTRVPATEVRHSSEDAYAPATCSSRAAPSPPVRAGGDAPGGILRWVFLFLLLGAGGAVLLYLFVL